MFTNEIRNEKNASSSNSFILSQTSIYYNPYSVVVFTKSGSKAYELNNILFYDENGVQTQTSRGWFGNNNNLEKITFVTSKPICVKRVPKEDFDFSKMDYPFVIKDISCSYENRYFLYIPISDLPKFEYSYKKESKMIRKYTDIGLPDSSANFIGETVKYLGDSMNIRIELDGMLESMQHNDIYQKSDEEFNKAIQDFIALRETLKNTLEHEKNYTVEDYLAEING